MELARVGSSHSSCRQPLPPIPHLLPEQRDGRGKAPGTNPGWAKPGPGLGEHVGLLLAWGVCFIRINRNANVRNRASLSSCLEHSLTCIFFLFFFAELKPQIFTVNKCLFLVLATVADKRGMFPAWTCHQLASTSCITWLLPTQATAQNCAVPF